jgi:3-hydroxyacyl-[acyl-carrier-protein] dehydratase
MTLAPDDVPFAAPLLAVDRVSVTRTESGAELRAWKLVDAVDPYLAAHFPGFTVFPGVFLIESVRQAAALSLGAGDGGFADLIAVRSARFLAPLLAGDTMTVDAVIAPANADGSFAVEASVLRSDGVTAARLTVEMRYGGPANV